MTAQEYGLWLAWHSREPLDAGWLQAGMQASLLANINRGKNSEPFSVADFIPQPWDKQKAAEIDPAAWVKSLNG